MNANVVNPSGNNEARVTKDLDEGGQRRDVRWCVIQIGGGRYVRTRDVSGRRGDDSSNEGSPSTLCSDEICFRRSGDDKGLQQGQKVWRHRQRNRSYESTNTKT